LGDDEGALDDYEAYMEIEKAMWKLEKKENDRAGDDRRKED
jgi:hypothetical protein